MELHGFNHSTHAMFFFVCVFAQFILLLATCHLYFPFFFLNGYSDSMIVDVFLKQAGSIFDDFSMVDELSSLRRIQGSPARRLW